MLDNRSKLEMGAMLKALRNESHLSLTGVSALTKLTPNKLDQIEIGILPSDFMDNELITLCDVYHIDTDYFQEYYWLDKRKSK